MRYTEVSQLSAPAFKRLVGVSPQLFDELLQVLEEAESHKRKSGRPSPLSLADQLLLTLSYWREYRTLFHLGVTYGIHESTAQRIVTRTEERLANAQCLDLERLRPHANADAAQRTVFIVDASESPIERPKKNKNGFTAAKSTSTL